MSEQLRLSKYIAHCGVASRRASEDLIANGKVKVNGEVVTEFSTKVNPDVDEVKVNDEIIKPVEKKYLIFNKPLEYVCTRDDPNAEKIIFDLLPDIPGLHNIGRLDQNTEGLLLLTNDGDLTMKLTHPSYEVPKTYVARVKGKVTKRVLEQLRRGVDIMVGDEVYYTKPAKVELLHSGKKTSVVKITLKEGKKRQVRMMFKRVGHKVCTLKRIGESFLNLDNLKVGDFRYLTDEEVKRLYDEA